MCKQSKRGAKMSSEKKTSYIRLIKQTQRSKNESLILVKHTVQQAIQHHLKFMYSVHFLSELWTCNCVTWKMLYQYQYSFEHSPKCRKLLCVVDPYTNPQ